MSSEQEIIAARISRMEALIKDLETKYADSAEAQAKFRTLQAELNAARASLKSIT